MTAKVIIIITTVMFSISESTPNLMTNFIITLRKQHFESKLFVNDKKPFLTLFLQQESEN